MNSANAAFSHGRNWESLRDGEVSQRVESPDRNTNMPSSREKPFRVTQDRKHDRESQECISASSATPMGVVNLGRGGARLTVQFETVERAASLKLVPGPAWVEQDGRRTPISLLESPSPVGETSLIPPTMTEATCVPLDPFRQEGLSPCQFRRVLAFINDHISRTVTLSELAREAGLSAAYFSQRFKSSTGTSPHQYLMRLRIRKAKKLLEESESPVIEIAMECGFQTQQHFARIFRRLTMRTPTEHRWQSQRLALESSYRDLPYMNNIII